MATDFEFEDQESPSYHEKMQQLDDDFDDLHRSTSAQQTFGACFEKSLNLKKLQLQTNVDISLKQNPDTISINYDPNNPFARAVDDAKSEYSGKNGDTQDLEGQNF